MRKHYMNIIITGATGFIGQHVIPLLLAEGHSITAIVRNELRAKKFIWSDDVHFIIQDIHADFVCDNSYEDHDTLIHLAWSGLPNYTSLFHFEENLPKEYLFIKKMVDLGVKNVLVTGTCFEYGMQSGQLSEDLLTKPDNAYGYAKDSLRRQLQFLQTNTDFNLTWARLFYLFGDGQAESSLYPKLKESIENGDKVFNMSGGEQIRDFQSVEQAADQIIRLALAEKNLGVINACSGTPITVRNLVENWISENKWDITLNLGHYPYPEYEPMRFWGDRERLNSILAEL